MRNIPYSVTHVSRPTATIVVAAVEYDITWPSDSFRARRMCAELSAEPRRATALAILMLLISFVVRENRVASSRASRDAL